MSESSVIDTELSWSVLRRNVEEIHESWPLRQYNFVSIVSYYHLHATALFAWLISHDWKYCWLICCKRKKLLANRANIKFLLTRQGYERIRLPRHLCFPLVHVRHRNHLPRRLSDYLNSEGKGADGQHHHHKTKKTCVVCPRTAGANSIDMLAICLYMHASRNANR